MARPVDTAPPIIIHTCIHHIIPTRIYIAQEQIVIMVVAAGMASFGEESKAILQWMNASFCNYIILS